MVMALNFVIASEAKQSSLDCRGAARLAMTGSTPIATVTMVKH
jgi:hypothetical protein